ncbi:hypothetical protein B0I72DRAFT_175806 [Yarrowia lipolytica]|nr:hypothetical protein BKA91DRAFT_165806 [Yarrowia lipolytica]KAE8174854.1 hypothetical protein BKA90DRAFT_166044 [Yarrowia lipolytica]RDW31060.1 hypothetical protein B0I72DRAFT_175806 [Yarrowia lipolytica]RDW43942.1 hypothetical protein B0I74DRAFT_175777 [Yarrowia lipolytica]RDW50651.1 hypothetical protein B0I75DRAFT_160206 [Yarrowia lipolytica]
MIVILLKLLQLIQYVRLKLGLSQTIYGKLLLVTLLVPASSVVFVPVSGPKHWMSYDLLELNRDDPTHYDGYFWSQTIISGGNIELSSALTQHNGMTCKLSSPALERLADGDKTSNYTSLAVTVLVKRVFETAVFICPR